MFFKTLLKAARLGLFALGAFMVYRFLRRQHAAERAAERQAHREET